MDRDEVNFEKFFAADKRGVNDKQSFAADKRGNRGKIIAIQRELRVHRASRLLASVMHKALIRVHPRSSAAKQKINFEPCFAADKRGYRGKVRALQRTSTAHNALIRAHPRSSAAKQKINFEPSFAADKRGYRGEVVESLICALPRFSEFIRGQLSSRLAKSIPA